MNALSRAEERGSRGSTGAGSTKDERSAEQCSGESVWVSEITRELEVRGALDRESRDPDLYAHL